MIGILGGSGLTQLADLGDSRRQVVRTPYGDPSGPLTLGHLNGVEVVFLARHGYGHTIAPHEINYRANLWALHDVGVTQIVAVATVGGIRPDLVAGKLLIPDQLIDYTWGRESTFFEGTDQAVNHIDFTHPYDVSLHSQLCKAAQSIGVTVLENGTYGCTQGPRLETAAEIRRMARDGCDTVGMTGMPEAALARELGMAYGAINVVVNAAAGVGDSADRISLEAIEPVMKESMEKVRRLLLAFAMLK